MLMFPLLAGILERLGNYGSNMLSAANLKYDWKEAKVVNGAEIKVFMNTQTGVEAYLDSQGSLRCGTSAAFAIAVPVYNEKSGLKQLDYLRALVELNCAVYQTGNMRAVNHTSGLIASYKKSHGVYLGVDCNKRVLFGIPDGEKDPVELNRHSSSFAEGMLELLCGLVVDPIEKELLDELNKQEVTDEINNEETSQGPSLLEEEEPSAINASADKVEAEHFD
jgi:hypothetical protein